ncbi:MAG TPA: hypothetical protein VMA31_01985 [Bryobacteraceae bacterium]|nr:hypothetical protein [Bryobacteraceae bacterium]
MSGSGERYMFAGHAIGAAARFHRLDDVENLNHVIPVQGGAVLSPTGGRSEARVRSRFEYRVDLPRPRCLLAVDRVNAWVEGRDPNGRVETEVGSEVKGMEVLEKLRIESLDFHMLAVRPDVNSEAKITTHGNRITGLRMGKVEAKITLDDEPLTYAGSQRQLAEFWRDQTEAYRERNRNRFYTTPDGKELAEDHGWYRFSLVSGVEFSGPEEDRAAISLEGGYTIRWKGFGRIILGEVYVKTQERKALLVRLAMGSDGGGDGSGGGGGSNGNATGG